jgi:sugar diacid utilization regulator
MGCESSQDMFKRQKAASVEQNEMLYEEHGVRCEMMSRTGSNRKTKVCRTIEQIKKDEEVAQNTLKRLRKPEITRDN